MREYVWLNDEPLALLENGQVYYYTNDHLGSAQVLTNQAGEVVWLGHYSPFGQVTVDPASTVGNNLRFDGQYFDAETGLHYNWHRYYDPLTGRYLTPDPIGLEGGINLFVYAGNNPLRFVDPEGLFNNPIAFWYNIYRAAHEQRIWGHQNFPGTGESISSMRHCVVSCMLASEYGVAEARVAGFVNELQGVALHDIPNLRSRINRTTPWAFQFRDIASNECGFACSEKIQCREPKEEVRDACIECCSR